jgi:hypothetical protein
MKKHAERDSQPLGFTHVTAIERVTRTQKEAQMVFQMLLQLLLRLRNALHSCSLSVVVKQVPFRLRSVSLYVSISPRVMIVRENMVWPV